MSENRDILKDVRDKLGNELYGIRQELNKIANASEGKELYIIRDELEGIRSELGDIANSLGWIKGVIIGLCIYGGIILIKDIIKWLGF